MWVNNAGLDGATTYRHLILMEDYVVNLRPKVVLFLVGINDVGAGDLAAAEPRRGHDLRHRWRALLYRSEVYALGQNLFRYFIAQSRGLHHTEIDLRKAGRLDQLPAGDRVQDVAGLRDQLPALFCPAAGKARQGLPGPRDRAGPDHPADPLRAGRLTRSPG